MFEKLYLDQFYMWSLKKIAFQENICKPECESDFEALRVKRNPLKAKTLQFMTLFEEVDGIFLRDDMRYCLSEIGVLKP